MKKYWLGRSLALCLSLTFLSSRTVVGQPQDTKPWKDAGFGDVQWIPVKDTDLYPPNDPKSYTSRFNLTVVVLRKSGWESEEVLQRLKRVAEIYSQCGVKLGKVTLVEGDSPFGGREVSREWDESSEMISKALPTSVERPVLFYIGAEEGYLTGFSAPKYFVRDFLQDPSDPLLDTAWVTSATKTMEYKKGRDSAYSTEAHELGHILTDAGHVMGSRNLMAADKDYVNDKLNPKQCETIHKSPLVTPVGE